MTLPFIEHLPRRLHLVLAAAGLVAIVEAGGTPALAVPLLSEIFYDAVGSDDAQVFVELSGEPGGSVDGFLLEGINGADGAITVTLELAGRFGADGLFVLADADSSGVTAVAGADQRLSFDFQNGPDSIILRDGQGVILDAVGYGTFGPGEFFAGEGSPAPDPAAGSSLARVDPFVDRGDNALDFEVLASPTPGTAPGVVPEPALGVLLAWASAGLVIRRRRA